MTDGTKTRTDKTKTRTDGTKTSERLEKLSAICLGFPEAVREDKGSHASFRVAKKVFAYYLNDHHGDGIVSVCCKALPGDNERLIAANPRKFHMPAYIGPRGWVGLRLNRPTVDWTEVKELVQGSYRQTAPKRLLGLLEEADSPSKHAQQPRLRGQDQ